MGLRGYTTIFTLTFSILLAVNVRASCPKARPMANFDITKYVGTWFEIQAKPSIFQPIETCLASVYSLQGSKALKVSSQGRKHSGEPASTSSTLNQKSPNTGDFSTDFVAGFTVPYQVLDTDYQTYACVHSCLSVFTITNEFNFVYSRQRTLDSKNLQHCQKVFRANGANLEGMQNTQQNACKTAKDELRR
ncbi:crustacyanin-A2 subunit-like [Oratosquilla oratoria]|uniref:crustacyanin-A2 subunit-like n=1 Tax=Oratosquilla oratoria TaxID=337810 RepID=UPI003F75EF57